MNPFTIIKDSSIWVSTNDTQAMDCRDPYLRIGIVKKAYQDKETNDYRFLVEVRDKNNTIHTSCRLMRKFGGAYNYEDYLLRGYTYTDRPDATNEMANKPGDIVLVAFLNGQAREGIILGSISHPARKPQLSPDEGPQYKSEFNGVETYINQDGEYSLIFKGMPINTTLLKVPPSAIPITAPIYNKALTGSYFKIDKTGSIDISDASIVGGPQSIKIDKMGGTITVKAGSGASLTLSKLIATVDLKCKMTNIASDISFKVTTTQFKVDAKVSVSIKGTQVAIGNSAFELFKELGELIDALAEVSPISPVGPCTPLGSTPQWLKIMAFKIKLKAVTGSL